MCRIIILQFVFLLTAFSAFCQDHSIYKTLPVNEEIADTLKDYELIHRVFTNIHLSFEKGNNSLKEVLAKKSIQEQTLYYASFLDMQVLNGGIYQYFANYQNQFNTEIINALEILGRQELSSSFQKISTLTSKSFDMAQGEYTSFNQSYYKNNQKESMDSFLKKYILENIEVFKRD